MTQLGIALARTPRGRFKVYWAMIVAAPDLRVQAAEMMQPDRPPGRAAQKRAP